MREISEANLKFLVFTGTSGKTTMKDTVYTTLYGLNIPVSRSVHGYNNELGIILTIMGMQDFSIKNPKGWFRLLNKKVIKNRFICIELGADFYKDIEWFLKKFSPYGVFISSSYSSSWSRDIFEVEKDRKRIFKATVSNGFIAYNSDDVTIQKLVKESDSKAHLIPFSLTQKREGSVFVEFWKNPFKVLPVNEAVHVSDMLTVNVYGKEYDVNLPRATFEPQVYGILASYACMYHISEASSEEVSQIMTDYQFSENRLQIYVAKNGAVIIEDSYKATPLCTSWYLDMSSKIIARRKVLVITEMRPLTFDIRNYYKEVARQSLFADSFFFLGSHKMFKTLHDNNKRSKEVFVDGYQVLSKNLLESTEAGDVILLKGSFRYNLSRLRSMLV
jgi:UDP-N-acetylmuramoyl-tripeptide--D-alanyl-D-alanine ligase